MWQGYVYVNDVRYSNIFTFAVGIFFVNTTHVGAKSALLRRLFVPAAKKTSSARSLAHPFQIEPAALGFDLGLGADWRAAASMLLRCIKNPERKRVRDFVLFERARGRGDVSAPLLMCPRAAGVSGWPPGGAFG